MMVLLKELGRLLTMNLNRRGDKKKFKEFVSAIKKSPHSYYYIKSTLAKFRNEGIDVNTQVDMGKTLLHVAIKLKNIRLLNMFIKAGVNLNLANEMGNTPLH